MELKDKRQVQNTREKLRRLEECYDDEKRSPDGDAHSQELTLQSLKRIINQLKEEIVRYASCQVVAREVGRGAGKTVESRVKGKR